MEYVKETPNNCLTFYKNNAVSVLFDKLEKTCLEEKKSGTYGNDVKKSKKCEGSHSIAYRDISV